MVIRLVPARTATEKVREISITTKGQGPVVIASVAIYNRQTGLTYNSVGYPGAQASLVNKFNVKLLANDLVRINPQIVVLSFGTNEASNESLDIANYTAGYERMIQKIKTTLPEAQIVVISPPDFSEQSGAAGCKKDKAGKCRGPAEANAAKGSSDATGCGWRTPARLAQIREAQREVAQRNGLVYWNWASIMPSECGAHRWFTATPPLMAKDHVHFTIEGYRKSAEQFLNTLIPVIEKVRVSGNRLFPTIEFALFFAVVFPLTWLLNDLNTAKKWFLVAASYFFYAAWRADFTLILLTSSVVNFCLALLLGQLADGRGRLALLWLGIAVNLGLLGAFKYYNFFAASTMNLASTVGWNLQIPSACPGVPRELLSHLPRAVLHHRRLPS